MNKVPSARTKLQHSSKGTNNNGVSQLKPVEGNLEQIEKHKTPAPPWKTATRNNESPKTAATEEQKTETSSLSKSSPPKSVGIYHGEGYVPKRYRRKKGWIRRWLEVFGIGLDHVILEDSLAEEVVDGLELTPADVRKMMASFDRIDTGGNGYFDYQDFLIAVREKDKGHYTKVLFDVIDVNKDTVIDFNEWVRVLGTYCMFTHEELQRFVFDSFDSDSDGFLGNQDLKSMIRLVDAEHKGKGPLSPQEIVNGYDADRKGKINFVDFQTLCRNYPMVFYSAQHLQEDLQYLTLGKPFFAKVMEKKQAVVELLTYQREHKGDLPPLSARDRRMFKQPTKWWSFRGGQKDPRRVALPSSNTRWLLLAGYKLYTAHEMLADLARKRNAQDVANQNNTTTHTRVAVGGGGERLGGSERGGRGASAGGGGGMGGTGGGRDMYITKKAGDDSYLSTTGKAIAAAKKTNKQRRATYAL